ncbi:MAG: hypothetical protein P4N60_00235 [Verrucomicrobiae bacterium]|nr:hypothetical protein [Verrucomicrobiae bacterium]
MLMLLEAMGWTILKATQGLHAPRVGFCLFPERPEFFGDLPAMRIIE